MRPVVWKLALAVVVGLGAGTFGGQAVIAGMAPPAVSLPSYPIDRRTAAIMPRRRPAGGERRSRSISGGSPTPAATAPISTSAIASPPRKRLRSTADCMDYSWSYQRGCLAYLREG